MIALTGFCFASSYCLRSWPAARKSAFIVPASIIRNKRMHNGSITPFFFFYSKNLFSNDGEALAAGCAFAQEVLRKFKIEAVKQF